MGQILLQLAIQFCMFTEKLNLVLLCRYPFLDKHGQKPNKGMDEDDIGAVKRVSCT
jgi:hypothetical protein